MKRILPVLCAVLLAVTSVVPVRSLEPAQPRDPVLVKEAENLYRKCRYAAGRKSFSGVCGLMTSYQLWQLGINESMIVCDGNKQFDAYKNEKVTSGGYNIRTYYAEEYNLEDTLNAITYNGTKDVKNILVGFQWTNTAKGGMYGHAVVINAIQDGVVYFTESYDYAMGYMEGQTITCSIPKFAEFFADWTRYEGSIYFGEKQYANDCQSYGTNAFVQLRFDSTLRSQPCLLGQNNCSRLRPLSAGELLRATGVYRNDCGDLFYRIDDGQVTGYVSANAVFVTELDPSGIDLKNGFMTAAAEPGENMPLVGTVVSDGAALAEVALEVTDSAGTVVRRAQMDVQGDKAPLSMLEEPLALNTLPAGSYEITLKVSAAYAQVEGTAVNAKSVWQTLESQALQVGAGDRPAGAPLEEVQEQPDGWVARDGIWYCYAQGKPLSGWTKRVGVDYYLKENGAVTTGWLEQDGKVYYFSATGALCKGWVTTDAGTFYITEEGALQKGMCQIDGKNYWFYSDGRLRQHGTLVVNGRKYTIQKDGVAVPAKA